METQSKYIQHKKIKGDVALNDPNDKSSKGKSKQLKWTVYSYDEVTVSINIYPLGNLDYLKSSYIKVTKKIKIIH